MNNNLKVIAVGLAYNESSAICYIELKKSLVTGNENYFDISKIKGLHNYGVDDIELNLVEILSIDP